jgi:hypothetical protein
MQLKDILEEKRRAAGRSPRVFFVARQRPGSVDGAFYFTYVFATACQRSVLDHAVTACVSDNGKVVLTDSMKTYVGVEV